MNINLIEKGNFEMYIKKIIKQKKFNNYCNFIWQEQKSRIIYKDKKGFWKKHSVIIEGQGVDIVGHIFGFNLAIEVKESYMDAAYISSKLTKEQKEYLIDFQKKDKCKSFVLLYFHKSQKLFIIKFPSRTKKIYFNMGEKKDVWIYKWEDLNLENLWINLWGIILTTN